MWSLDFGVRVMALFLLALAIAACAKRNPPNAVRETGEFHCWKHRITERAILNMEAAMRRNGMYQTLERRGNCVRVPVQ